MIQFRGLVTDVFEIPHMNGLVLQLTRIEGDPEVGMQVRVGGKRFSIAGLGQKSTDGKTVMTRSCLTGQSVAPYGVILLDWEGGAPEVAMFHNQWVTEEAQQ